jgi:predicted glycogen debranching enzyme
LRVNCRIIERSKSVLNLRKIDEKTGISVTTAHQPIEQLLEKEWLLTNGRGAYSSSTIVGCNTRRYHGLLVGSFERPANRILALANCLETVYFGSEHFDLSSFEFPNGIIPAGYLRQKSFSKDLGVHFHYKLGELCFTKSIYLMQRRNTVAVVYEFEDLDAPVEFVIRPLVALRDFHLLQRSSSYLLFKTEPQGVLVHHTQPELGNLFLSCPDAAFESEPHWWFNFIYRADRQRGQDFSEDLFSPGFFKCRVNYPQKLVLWADFTRTYKSGHFVPPDIEYEVGQLCEYTGAVIRPAESDNILSKLYLAADQFIVKTESQGAERTTIFAGFPWFADWGRDAFISLHGLLLSTNRFEEAKSVLLTFAAVANQGVIPNRFDDYNAAAHFNSVDASLWFISAAYAYMAASGDRHTFQSCLLPTIISIIDSFQHGTSFGIHADSDGLILAGDASTQLTWMDAKYDGVVFTPRHGKPVEVNALWYNAIMLLVDFLSRDVSDYARLLSPMKARAAQVKRSFNEKFWNGHWGWLNDCIGPDGAPDATLRPNQIFAVSLPYSPLEHSKQKAVVDVVAKKLLTPFGLRSLSPDDPRYQRLYTGNQASRDKAYHQGTVWAYLIGPFVEAYLKVHVPDEEHKKQAAKFIDPLLKHLADDGCIGQVSEIFDAESPNKPKGCFAQAWSVAELIRAYLMTK